MFTLPAEMHCKDDLMWAIVARHIWSTLQQDATAYRTLLPHRVEHPLLKVTSTLIALDQYIYNVAQHHARQQ